jgi:sugar/nucleoside kinase (ribokinase family)
MAATAMAAAARLGARCALVLCVGDDPRGTQVIQHFEEIGVDVSSCSRKPGSTPLVMVLVDSVSGERHFLPLRDPSPHPGPEDIDWELAARANVFLLDAWTTNPEQVLERAQEAELTTLVDTDFQPGEEPDWISLVDIYIGGCDRPEWRAEPDRALAETERILAKGPHTAILTLGSEGCVGIGPEGHFRIPGFPVDVVDTCGAGDVFRGGYAWALEQGWRARHCAAFAGATSALSATALGGRAALPTADEVSTFLLDNGQEGPWKDLAEISV